MDKIDLTSLENAITTLDEIIERYDREYYDNAIRDAVIQRFEYTYSLTLKFVSRFLKKMMPEQVDSLAFNDIIREANKFGFLLSNLEKWTLFRQKRNLSSHTYNEKIALSIVEIVKDFREEAHYVLNRLKENNG